VHDEPGDVEGGMSLRTAWMPALTALVLSSRREWKEWCSTADFICVWSLLLL